MLLSHLGSNLAQGKNRVMVVYHEILLVLFSDVYMVKIMYRIQVWFCCLCHHSPAQSDAEDELLISLTLQSDVVRYTYTSLITTYVPLSYICGIYISLPHLCHAKREIT